MSNQRIKELKEQIADVLKRWPAHTPSPALVQQLDDLEDELAKEIKKTNQEQNQIIQFTPIGYVENSFESATTPESIPQSESIIRLSPSLKDGLEGLVAGQRLLVIFYFHKSEGFKLKQHPRGDPSQPQRGVFALRSPNRPNPIGATIVDILAIDVNNLRVKGLDALNGTPVLDLKPA